jgi:hypothetical protein
MDSYPMHLLEPGPRVSDADLDELECLVGFPLPSEYRSFLLEHNGGRPEACPTMFRIAAASEFGRYLRGELSANTMSAQSVTPEGFTWHHVEGGETLQLVPYDVHLITGRHVSVYQFQEKNCRAGAFIEGRRTLVGSRVVEDGPSDALQVFFRVKGHPEISNVEWNYRALAGRIARDLLPIACDGSGNIICIALSGGDRGTIYFWDWYEEDVPPSYENVYFLAGSFDLFLERLWTAT